MRAMFGRLRFSNEAANALTDEQGLDSLEELGLMKDDDVANVCKTLRRPGGTTTNDNGDVIANPGHNVSLKAEKNLKLAVFFVQHKKRCSEDLAFADVTLDSVRRLQSLYDLEKGYEKPDEADSAKIINTKDWTKTFDSLDEYLESVLGVTGVPLSYITRKNQAPADAPGGGWLSEREKMIKRAPHFTLDAAGAETTTHTDAYISDNLEVWNILSKLCRNSGDLWTYVKAGQARKDGRAAFNSMYNHYLGAHNVENQANHYERLLRENKYYGEKRRHNFHKYSTNALDYIQALNNLKPYGYSGVDERSAVRYLVDNVMDSSLDATKNAILTHPELRTDFTACVTLFTDFINQRKDAVRKETNVSDVSTTDNKNKNNKNKNGRATKGSTGVEFRYYKQSDYKKLSDKQKDELRLWRKEREEGGRPAKKQKTSVELDRGSVDRLVAALEATTVAQDQGTSDADADAATETTDNRTNPALTRQPGRRR